MTKWSKLIEDNWETITDAMQKAAKAVGEGDGESVLRVEFNRDGTVDTYWTFQNIVSNAVRDGVAFPIKDYYGGEYWNEEWADTYDAAFDLEMILHNVQQNEKDIIESAFRRIDSAKNVKLEIENA